MKKKITLAALLVTAVSLLAACSMTAEKTQTPTDIPTAAQATVAPSTTAEPSTLPVTTTLPTTTAAPTTLPPSTKAPATAPVTVKPTVEKTTAFVTKQNSQPTLSPLVLSSESVEETELKYGIVMHTYETLYYQYLADGSQHILDKKYTYTFNYSAYDADYDDLLPAAKAAREEYSSYINEVLRIINGYRAEGGLAPLKLNEKLTRAACVRSEEIGWSGKFSHVRPNLLLGTTIVKEEGFREGKVGENIGRGYPTPAAVCAAWKDSETHYEIIMTPEFKETGIGVSAGPPNSGGLYWTQFFYEPD